MPEIIPSESKEKAENLTSKKLDAEIKRIQAETSRIELEIEEIGVNVNTPWYKNRLFIQAVVAGIVAIPLFWFYVKEIALPMFTKENIELALKNAETKKKLRDSLDQLSQDKIIHDVKVKKLENIIVKIRNERLQELEELKKDYQKLQVDYRKLINQMDKPKKSKEKIIVLALEKVINEVYEKQEEKINNLQSKIRKIEEFNLFIDEVGMSLISPVTTIVAASGPGSDIVKTSIIDQLSRSKIALSELSKYMILVESEVKLSDEMYQIQSYRVTCSIQMIIRKDNLLVPSVSQVLSGIIFGLDLDQALHGAGPNRFHSRIAEPIANKFIDDLLNSDFFNKRIKKDAQ